MLSERWLGVRQPLGWQVWLLLPALLLAASLPAPALLPPAFGASAILLAALPDSPVSRPWPVLGGSLLAACAAWLAVWLGGVWHIALPLLLAGAVLLALLAMHAVRGLHPPGGALAAWLVLHPHPHLPTLLLGLLPGLSVLVLWSLALQYRHSPPAQPMGHLTRDPLPSLRAQPGAADWQAMLRAEGLHLDISPVQLQNLYQRLWQAGHLPSTRQVADIMSRDLVSIHPEASLGEAWQRLQQHRIKLLPVVRDRQLVGVVALVDLLKRLGLGPYSLSVEAVVHAQQLLSQRVGDIMNPPQTVGPGWPLARLIPQLSDWGLHQVPVVDDDQCLLGMVTQSDLIAALSQSTLLNKSDALR